MKIQVMTVIDKFKGMLHHPKRSPRSASYYSLGSSYTFFFGSSTFFLGSSFFSSFFTSFLEAAAGAGTAVPSLPCPSAMSWWTVLPLRELMTSVISASVAWDWTLPRRPLRSWASKWREEY
jgi:hypothetical protein